MIEFFKIIKRWLQNGQRQMPEVGHYFLLHLFLLYAACLGLACRVGHLSDIISVSEARSLLENAFYSRKLKNSAKNRASTNRQNTTDGVKDSPWFILSE